MVFAFVAALAFLLLLAAFRSVTLPLVSIVLNLLSVGAGYGLITLIFQDGRLQHLLGYTSFGGIVFWVPLFMFVLLFGLSMDYHVFILSRIRELRSRGETTRNAIVGGISSSAGVVTSAAVIMVAVFHPGDPAHRRHRGARHLAPRGHDPARRAVLVPATLAVLASRPEARSRACSPTRSAPNARMNGVALRMTFTELMGVTARSRWYRRAARRMGSSPPRPTAAASVWSAAAAATVAA